VNPWILAAIGLLPGLAICLVVLWRGGIMEQFVALQMSGVVTVLMLMLLAEGTAQPGLLDVAVALALLSLPGNLLFAHFLREWLS